MDPELDDDLLDELAAIDLPGEADAEDELSPLLERVNRLLLDAAAAGASHIHVDPMGSGCRVRYRIDGELHEREPTPPGTLSAVVSRLKILGSLDISERRRPQDGKLKIENVSARMAVHPVMGGERIVISLAAPEGEPQTLGELEVTTVTRRRLEEALGRKAGMVLVAGGRGAGKRTTLYALVRHLNRPELCVVTAEDPVARLVEGVAQSQIKPAVGLGYAALLRSLRQQDPDVFLVQSVKEPEVAGLASEIAADGYLVLAGIGSEDACDALLDLAAAGAAPPAFVLAQRLVRRAKGRGRVPVCETLTVGPRVRGALAGAAGAGELRAIAIDEGLEPFAADARRQVEEGRVSADEVRRQFPEA